VLGVPRTASAERIKAAHRSLVRHHHPDLAAPEERESATRRVQQINVAYGLLRDEAARAAYDRALRDADPAIERLAATAGVWAGRWWERNRAALLQRPPQARLSWIAGRAVGRVLRRGGR
jgi:curved DNA-binding protein CbpA